MLPRASLPSAFKRRFSLSAVVANRAVVYSKNGDPSEVLTAVTFPDLPPPKPNSVNIRFVLSAVNPADINTIEGVSPSKPTLASDLNTSGPGSKDYPIFVGGNEGLAEVVEVGDGVQGLQKNDWVVMDKPQLGTWSTHRNVAVTDIIKLPFNASDGLSKAHGATMTVNPPTAFNMLKEFVDLKEGDWIVQNGANSAVGKLVIQIASSRGLNTLNLVRARDNLEKLMRSLEELGATRVLTYDDLRDKATRSKIQQWTGGKDIRLGLNCIGGEANTAMVKLLGHGAHLVSYGAMSKQPISLPTSLFIFKNLTSHGFWQTQWSKVHSRKEKEDLIANLSSMMVNGKLKAPEHDIIVLGAKESDEEVTQKIRTIFSDLAQGKYTKKVLIRLEDK
ncbi:trans-2-enoyl-CoA reductase [Dendrothele bispora CBS 962.96]|uniref:enoyl-[acyl-carrier-protein] reductase n=1 Tax=Dendrothele bispora (strain CBS 962.96) TaxID=1314807 RepID=A0A4S8MB26_DENBC|nr:trans-2-enoyl-CoA reductase [Dendrothele bispora CBS 962.96]